MEIVLIEDNPEDIEMTLAAFRGARFTNPIQVLRDGGDAMDFLFGTPEGVSTDPHAAPKMILLDMHLPKVLGLDILRRIRSEPRTRDWPVLVLTASQEEQLRIESRRLGVSGYILKPVSFQKFAAAAAMLSLSWLIVQRPPRANPHSS